ncbi:hypothetical protein H0H81_005515 [Sphagnurus paluster]|uniref:Uncharacterized protein n=1 Tax=Sphagnurus paluster TaxID=117069 RepID=A0A9P7KLJ8_9AGAR|nr:hypothetical protein H0H81_005515 [Sphagnurus paluster]
MLATVFLTLLPLLATQVLPVYAQDPTDQDLLSSCPGGGGSPNVREADRCTLINTTNNPDVVIYKNMGNAVQNCGGSTTATTVTLGGSTSFATTVEVNANFGFSYEGLSIGGGASTSETTTETTSNEISYDVPPGRQAVYTAGYNYKSETGNVQVNYGKRVADHYIWYTGTTVTKLTPDSSTPARYQVHATKCGKQHPPVRVVFFSA